MNTKQIAETIEAHKQRQSEAKQIAVEEAEQKKWTYQTVEWLYGCTLNPMAAVKVADAHNAAIEKALKLCNDRLEELRHKLHEATDRINEYMAALQSRATHAGEK